MKIANIDREILHNFWSTWGISMKFWGRMWPMIILKVTENQGFFLFIHDTKTKGAGQIDSPQPPRISHRLSKREKSKSFRLSLLNIILRQLSTSALRNLIKDTSFIWVMAFFNKADLDFVRSSYNFTPFFTLFPEYGERNTFEVLFDGLSK